MKKKMKKEDGFTLVEIIFALFCGLALMAAVYMALISGQKSSLALDSKVTALQGTRAVIETMAMEISMASFNANFVSNLWRDPANCGALSPNQAYKGIQVATATSLTLEMDRNENGLIGDILNDNEVISYVYDIPNQRMTRSANCNAATSFLGDIPGNPRSERVINNTLAIPVFRYFNGLGVEIAAASLPAEIPSIRRIQITLAVETEDIDPNTHQRRRMTYSTSVIPRNHAISQL
jgi:type II secretory pathway pseudopilin PulG